MVIYKRGDAGLETKEVAVTICGQIMDIFKVEP